MVASSNVGHLASYLITSTVNSRNTCFVTTSSKHQLYGIRPLSYKKYNFVIMGRKNKQDRMKRKHKMMKKDFKKHEKTEEKYTLDQILDKAQECMDTFNYELAQKFCQRSLEMDADNVRALEMSGALFLEMGNLDAAKQCFGRAMEVEPDTGHSKYMYMGQLLTGLDAINCFHRGIDVLLTELQEAAVPEGAQSKPSDGVSVPHKATSRDLSTAYCSVAEIYLTDACFEEDAETKCRECLEKAIAADASNPEAYHLQASYYMSVEDHKSAEETLDKGISLWLPQLREAENPEGACAIDPVQVCDVSYPARVNVVKILIELKKYDLCTEILEILLDEDDTVVEVWYLLGWSHYLQGDEYKNTARYYLKKANKVATDTACEDVQLVQHIDELLQKIGPGDDEDEEEEEDEMNLDDLDTDSEEEDTGTDAQTDAQTDIQTVPDQMEH